MSTQPPSRFAPYKHALTVLSTRTGTPVSSLIVSFAILHELSAILPAVGIFFGARALGVGERLVSTATQTGTGNWFHQRWSEWIVEGGEWAERIRRRYGLFGPENGTKVSELDDGRQAGETQVRIAGDVANAIVAYGLTKALFPVRIGLSLYLAPAFSRRIVAPIGEKVIRPFRRTPPS